MGGFGKHTGIHTGMFAVSLKTKNAVLANQPTLHSGGSKQGDGVWRVRYGVQRAVCSDLYGVFKVNCAVCSVLGAACVVSIVQCLLFSVHCAVCIVQ